MVTSYSVQYLLWSALSD